MPEKVPVRAGLKPAPQGFGGLLPEREGDAQASFGLLLDAADDLLDEPGEPPVAPFASLKRNRAESLPVGPVGGCEDFRGFEPVTFEAGVAAPDAAVETVALAIIADFDDAAQMDGRAEGVVFDLTGAVEEGSDLMRVVALEPAHEVFPFQGGFHRYKSRLPAVLISSRRRATRARVFSSGMDGRAPWISSQPARRVSGEA